MYKAKRKNYKKVTNNVKLPNNVSLKGVLQKRNVTFLILVKCRF